MDADAAARHRLPGERDLRDDGRQSERRHGEVERAQPQRRKTGDEAEDGAEHASRRQRQEGWDFRRHPAERQRARRVGADRQQRHPADRELAGETDDQIEACNQHPVDVDARGNEAEEGITP